MDLGAKYNLTDKTAIGAALTNFGTEMKFDKETESLPLLFKIGASHYIINDWLVSLDLNFPNDNEVYVNFGTQYGIEIADNLKFALRAGYEGRNKDVPGFNWINLGFGLEYLDYVFDYAFVPYGDIGMTHRFSFSIKFGKTVEKIDTFATSAEELPAEPKESEKPAEKIDTPTQETQTQQEPEIKETPKPAEKTAAKKQTTQQQTKKVNTQAGKK